MQAAQGTHRVPNNLQLHSTIKLLINQDILCTPLNSKQMFITI